MLVVAILVTGGAFLTLRSLNIAALRADRYRVTQEALIAAKEGLIARAVTDQNRPGSLPCPDLDNDGVAELFAGTACPAYIGRLPWKTLDIPDLRDASGERLWYALSSTHRDHSAAEPINSDTAGAITVTGTQPANNVVAIVFSSGAVVKRTDNLSVQDRSCIVGTNCDASDKCTTSPATNTPKCNSVNYLDIVAGVDNADANTTFVSAAETDAFNDRLLPILSDDIMSLVEKRAGRELAQRLRDHFDAWNNSANVSGANKGFYPWAAPFNDPANAQIGVNNTQYGLLPLSSTPLVWTVASGSCTGVGTTEIDCTAFVFCFFGVCFPTIMGRIANIATRFSDPPDALNVSVLVGLSLSGSSTWTLNKGAQSLDFTYGGFATGGLVRITARAPSPSAWLATPWLATNNWNQVSYYALSPGYAFTGSNSCGGAGPQCVTVSNTAAPNNNKEAVVITTGRALPGMSARPVTPPASISDFLEAGNQTPADLVFERNLRTSAFNDQPAVVRP